MFARLLLLLLLLPLAELVLLTMLADGTNWQTAVVVVLCTALAGALLIRRQSWRTLQRIRSELAAGRLPADALLDGLLIFIAGLLLLTPGLLTDTCAIGLLIPPVRRLIKNRLVAYFQSRFETTTTTTTIVEGTFVRRADESTWTRQNLDD